MPSITKNPYWEDLIKHHQRLIQLRIGDLFEQNPGRAKEFSLEVNNLFLDYSKNHIDQPALDSLISLANSVHLAERIEDLMHGKRVNVTEYRPACHTALRHTFSDRIKIDGMPIANLIDQQLAKMAKLSDQVQSHQADLTDIVNIGIGGSHLGPQMVTQALEDYRVNDLNYHFLANIDPKSVEDLLQKINPAKTIFIISSKSFTTVETLSNANIIKNLVDDPNRLYAITANKKAANEFGIPENNIFEIWDWVGGRYSLWSAVGLPILLRIGPDNFKQLLAGAHDMDMHFLEAPFNQNMPVILGLLSVWTINFFFSNSQAILPYSHQLRMLPAHLQQLDMESCGKQVTTTGVVTDYNTGSIIWGEAGTIGQHSFHQLLHQGTTYMPIDFILPILPEEHYPENRDILISSCLSQSACLVWGTPTEPDPHRFVPGNRPCNTLILDGLSPYSLGALIALYEHKIYVQSCIWEINPFDQFGVELGKRLTSNILSLLHNESIDNSPDASTLLCLDHIKSLLNK